MGDFSLANFSRIGNWKVRPPCSGAVTWDRKQLRPSGTFESPSQGKQRFAYLSFYLKKQNKSLEKYTVNLIQK